MPVILDPTTPSDPVGVGASVASLVDRVRRWLNDWPDSDQITGSLNSTTSTIPVGGTFYTAGDLIEVDSEAMLVRGVSGANLTVKRGAYGTTATTHASGATILYEPLILSISILDVLNDAVGSAFPYVYKSHLDTSLTAAADTFEYFIPSGIRFISRVQLVDASASDYFRWRNWNVVRGPFPRIQFKTLPTPGTGIRIEGYGPFPALTLSGSMDDEFPIELEYALVEYAGSCLMQSVAAARAAAGERQQKTGSDEQTKTSSGDVTRSKDESTETDSDQTQTTTIHSDTEQDSTTTTTTDGEQDQTQDTVANFDRSTQSQDSDQTTSEDKTEVGSQSQIIDSTETQELTGGQTQSVTGGDTETTSSVDSITDANTETQTMYTVQIAQQVADRALARFLRRVQNCGFPPMPRRITRTY